MALKLINSEEILLRVAGTDNIWVRLRPGVWAVKRIPNPKGYNAPWIRLVGSSSGLIIGSAEEALLGNYPDTVDIVE